jgi:hypothetical protein
MARRARGEQGSMAHFDDERRSPVERIVGQDLDEATGKGRRLSSRASQTRRSIDAYLKSGVRPRWMERVVEIDAGIARERRRLAEAYRDLEVRCGGHGAAFAQRWRAVARTWRFDPELNVLIEQHNAWYPIERDLPLNPRTGDYVRVGGRPYGRPLLGPEWVLEQFPAERPRRTR